MFSHTSDSIFIYKRSEFNGTWRLNVHNPIYLIISRQIDLQKNVPRCPKKVISLVRNPTHNYFEIYLLYNVIILSILRKDFNKYFLYIVQNLIFIIDNQKIWSTIAHASTTIQPLTFLISFFFYSTQSQESKSNIETISYLSELVNSLALCTHAYTS